MRQHWQSLRARPEDFLSIHDYLWRWDTDWFWCSRSVGAHLAPVRLLAAFQAQVGITPVWVCPFVATSDRFPLYRLRTDVPYVNFGFWDTVPSDQPEGHYNAIVERLVASYGGKKSLYSRSTYDESTFWSQYDRDAYQALKQRHDPEGRFPGLYEKAVRRV